MESPQIPAEGMGQSAEQLGEQVAAGFFRITVVVSGQSAFESVTVMTGCAPFPEAHFTPPAWCC